MIVIIMGSISHGNTRARTCAFYVMFAPMLSNAVCDMCVCIHTYTHTHYPYVYLCVYSTPDFITPKEQVIHNDFGCMSQKENCGLDSANGGQQQTCAGRFQNLRQKVFSPGRLTPQRVKRHRNAFNAFTCTQSQESHGMSGDDISSTMCTSSQNSEMSADAEGGGGRATMGHLAGTPGMIVSSRGTNVGAPARNENRHRYSILKRRLRSPPAFRNPFGIDDSAEFDGDASSQQQQQQHAGKRTLVGSGSGRFGQSVCAAHSLARYRIDFKEVAEIGRGNFSKVFRCMHRLEGVSYAVKVLNQRIFSECDLRQALLEVQSLAVVGPHPNIVRYFSSWIESEQLFIQMELCESTLLSSKDDGDAFTEDEVLSVMREISSALRHIHVMGIAHLDVKPDNIYVGRGGEYKLGDFGRAARMDCGTIIQDGDSRYMPKEMLNDDYSCLDKADIFSLGITALEVVMGKPPPESGAQYEALRAGKLPLLPACSMQLQKLISSMCSADARQRPSALEMMRSYTVLRHDDE